MRAFSERELRELNTEADHLKRAIVEIAQRVRPPDQTEKEQMQRWRARLLEIRTALGQVLSPSEERICLPAMSPQVPQVADPRAVLDSHTKQKDVGAALRIDKTS